MPRRAALRMPLPPSASLSSGGHARGELDQLVVEERRARLQPVGHGHVVHALDRVVDEHDPRVQPQRAVDRRGGARRARTTRRRTRARRRRRRGRGQLAQPRVVAVEELGRVGVEAAARRLEQRRVPAVAAEHLVGALAGLHDLALARDRLREQPERHAVVGDHRLAHRGDRLRERLDELVRADADLVVVGPELARDEVRERELVALAAARVGEADRERRQPALALLGEQRHDQARVQPAGEQDADGHVGDHPPPHGDAQRLAAARRATPPRALAASRSCGGFQ